MLQRDITGANTLWERAVLEERPRRWPGASKLQTRARPLQRARPTPRCNFQLETCSSRLTGTAGPHHR